MKIRYDIKLPNGEQQMWTGIFTNEERADAWYNLHGKEWERQGKVLIRVKCGDYFKQRKNMNT